jgi:hypothetical protein
MLKNETNFLNNLCPYEQRVKRPKIEIKCVQSPQIPLNDQETNENFEKIESL